MPSVTLQDPWGKNYRIDTRNAETLRAWFTEILPEVNAHFGERRTPPATIMVSPLFASAANDHADWHADTRVTGKMYPFQAKTGAAGMRELELLRKLQQDDLDEFRARSRDF